MGLWLPELLCLDHLFVAPDDVLDEFMGGIECPHRADNLAAASARGKRELFLIRSRLIENFFFFHFSQCTTNGIKIVVKALFLVQSSLSQNRFKGDVVTVSIEPSISPGLPELCDMRVVSHLANALLSFPTNCN